jgi:hypothetical protein
MDVGDYDLCIGGIFILQPLQVGDTNVYVNTDTDQNGVVLTRGDTVAIATLNPGHYEVVQIQDKVGFSSSGRLSPATSSPRFVLSAGIRSAFEKYAVFTRSCTAGDGVQFSDFYPCGCGIAVCEFGTRCELTDTSGYGNAGRCVGPAASILPTPAPTVSARGDPHLVNLNGEHFDVNHGGEFTLLRIPQTTMRPMLELKASILPEFGKPCTTYITELELSGLWLDGQVVQVRSYLRSHVENETDRFLGLRVLNGTKDAPSEVPWKKVGDWKDSVISEGRGHHYRVTLSTTQWNSNKREMMNTPTVAGQVEIRLQHSKLREEQTYRHASTSIVMRQDLPRQEHLNLAVRKLSLLGHSDIGGLLGFDPHPESLEDITPECQRHRDGLDRELGPRSKKAWKTRWEKIKERRGQAYASGGRMNDNEAAASLSESLIGKARDMMCVCSDGGPMEDPLIEDTYSQSLIGGRSTEGVLVDFQEARMAEASWD